MKNPVTVNHFHQRLLWVYLSLFLVPAVVVIFVDLGFKMEEASFKIENSFWIFFCPLLSLSAVLAEKYINSKLSLKSKNTTSLSSMLADYKKATILRFLLLEIPIIMSLLVFGWTRNVFFLALSILTMIYLFTIYPQMDKLIATCKPNAKQMVFFNNPNLTITD